MTMSQTDHIGRYKIIQRLGQGGMGAVYQAHDPDLNREVALKMVTLLGFDGSEAWRQRFRREVQAAARLNHPHIVTIYDVGLDHDPPYVVMELLTGGTLQERLQSKKKLPWQEAFKLLQPLAQALGYAHQAGMVHRDVKPANVMFARDELLPQAGGTLKLVDFGLARRRGGETVTQVGDVVGTPAYMSPEQAHGEETDARTDIFSLGIILFETIAGYNPLASGSHFASLAETRSHKPIDMTPLSQIAPPAVVDLLKKSVAKDREQRYVTCEALLADMAGCLGEPSDKLTTASRTLYSTWQPGSASNKTLVIQKSPTVNLSPEVERVLRLMFEDAGRLAIEAEFNEGLSQGRVFRVRPVDSRGKVHLPAVVKVAPINQIRREWQAYQSWVANIIPGVARLESAPTLPPGSLWDGLRYSLVGEGAFEVESLYSYAQRAPAQDVWWLLTERLYQLIGLHWWLERHSDRAFQMRADYDQLLPVNFYFKTSADRPESEGHLVTPEQLPTGIKQGEAVRLEGFVVTEIEPDKQQITLNLRSARPDEPPASYRVRLTEVADVEAYRLGQMVDALSGVVTATRHDLLVAEVSRAFGPAFDPTAEVLPVATATPDPALPPTLPNPLHHYAALLHNFLAVNISTIHGDLNLENILVDPATRHLNLIDFATVRRGHSLHDLLRLETETVTKLISAALAEARLPAVTIYTLYQQLHQLTPHLRQQPAFDQLPPALEKAVILLAAIRKMARNCLFNPDDWTEYYQGLVIYLLGALKFKNLDRMPHAPLPKQTAFWGAAAIQAWLTPTEEDAAAALKPLPSAPLQPPGTPQSRPSTIEINIPDVPAPASTSPSGRVVVQGDFVQGQKVGGDHISVGDISGSGVAIGRGAQVNINRGLDGDDLARLFEVAQQQIKSRPPDPDVEKEELVDLVKRLRKEVVKGEQASPKKVKRWLDTLTDLAPDVSSSIISGLARPLSGVSASIRQIAAEASGDLD